MSDKHTAAQGELPELPRPACTYADHSYPAFNKRQMEEYANAAIAKIRATEGQAQTSAAVAIDQCGTTRCACCDANLDLNEEHGDDCSAAQLADSTAPGAPVDGVHWDLFPGYLIDHQEGNTIDEEGLQSALAGMLMDADYLRIASERAAAPLPQVQPSEALDAARYRWLRSVGPEQQNVIAHYALDCMDERVDHFRLQPSVAQAVADQHSVISPKPMKEDNDS